MKDPDNLAAWQTRLEEAIGSGASVQPRELVFSLSWWEAVDFARDIADARQRLRDYHEGAQRVGRAGGKARAASLSPGRRSEIARIAANTRWSSD